MKTSLAAEAQAECVPAHPWLALQPRKENYLPPEYYDRILPEYHCADCPDTWFLGDFLRSKASKRGAPTLALGPGTGRCIRVILQNRPELGGSIDLLDQSAVMLETCVARFGRDVFRNIICADAIGHLEESSTQYETIVSMWSLSHSVHQLFSQEDRPAAEARVTDAFRRLFTKALAPGGRFFIMHFDALSEEQHISLRQRRRLYPFFRADEQSPSFQLLSRTLQQLREEGAVESEITHHPADPIVYRSIEHALEVFMNFHMETELNHAATATAVLAELEDDFKARQRDDGTVAVSPAWFIFQGTRL